MRMRPLSLTLTVAGVLLRLVPHPPNFTPVGATALYGGARLKGWQAYVIPLLIMAVTDPLLGAIYGFAPFSRMTPIIYGCFLLSVLIGRTLRASESVPRIAAATFLGSLQFYIITNGMIWMRSTRLYAHTLDGLMACYVAALPFFGRTLAGDFFYATALFGLHAWLSRKAFPAEVAA